MKTLYSFLKRLWQWATSPNPNTPCPQCAGPTHSGLYGDHCPKCGTLSD